MGVFSPLMFWGVPAVTPPPQSLEALLQLRLPDELGDSELLGRVAARLRPWAVSGTPKPPPKPQNTP